MPGVYPGLLPVEAVVPADSAWTMPGSRARAMPLDGLASSAASAGSLPAGALTPAVAIDAALLAEVTFLTGVDGEGRLVDGSRTYWRNDGESAHKWGGTTAGSAGGTVTYSFDAASGFTATEKNTFGKCFALWSAVANIAFAEVAEGTGAVRLQRGAAGSGAYEYTAYGTGSGASLGQSTAAVINFATESVGFDLGGDPNGPVGGYGLGSLVHEMGHLLGLGHGGFYNGGVNPAAEQFGPFDERMWTAMSYIFWGSAAPTFAGAYPVTQTNWGTAGDGYDRQVPHSWMPLDILAVQRLYGAASGGPLSGGQVFGFNSNIAGPLRDFFDFSHNRTPVVTLYDSGRGNTLDLSGYAAPATLDLRDGHFSSFNGMTNNLAIAFGTAIETGIGGSGNDTLQGNGFDNVLVGAAGDDVIDGGAGHDIAVYAVASNSARWARTATGYMVSAPGLGTDMLADVEVLRFTDGEVNPSLVHPTVWRFFNTVAGGHFFTTSPAERDSVIAQLPQFNFEGAGFYGADPAEASTVPVWRFFNTVAGGHFFTTSPAERDSVIAQLPQYNFEGIGYYAGTEAQGGFEPIYRFFNTLAGGHFFTTSPAERDNVIAQLPQYRFEGVGFYVPRSGGLETDPGMAGAAVANAAASYLW